MKAKNDSRRAQRGGEGEEDPGGMASQEARPLVSGSGLLPEPCKLLQVRGRFIM